MPTDTELSERLRKTIMTHVSRDHAERREALGDFLALSAPSMTETGVERLAELVPALPAELYRRWADMFIERLFATATRVQIEDLCAEGLEAEATTILTFLLFLESERMEKQIALDLKAFNQTATTQASEEAALASALGAYLRAKAAAQQAAAVDAPPAKQ